jgi:hypothetical protein
MEFAVPERLAIDGRERLPDRELVTTRNGAIYSMLVGGPGTEPLAQLIAIADTDKGSEATAPSCHQERDLVGIADAGIGTTTSGDPWFPGSGPHGDSIKNAPEASGCASRLAVHLSYRRFGELSYHNSPPRTITARIASATVRRRRNGVRVAGVEESDAISPLQSSAPLGARFTRA